MEDYKFQGKFKNEEMLKKIVDCRGDDLSQAHLGWSVELALEGALGVAYVGINFIEGTVEYGDDCKELKESDVSEALRKYIGAELDEPELPEVWSVFCNGEFLGSVAARTKDTAYQAAEQKFVGKYNSDTRLEVIKEKDEVAKPVTVNQLLRNLKELKQKGYGNAPIFITDDEEGNGYHGLWYLGEPACDLDMREEVEASNSDLYCLENKDMAIYMG